MPLQVPLSEPSGTVECVESQKLESKPRRAFSIEALTEVDAIQSPLFVVTKKSDDE